MCTVKYNKANQMHDGYIKMNINPDFLSFLLAYTMAVTVPFVIFIVGCIDAITVTLQNR